MFALMAMIAFLVYQNEYFSIKEKQKYKMQNYASKISSYIISAHMMNLDNLKETERLLRGIPKDSDFVYGLYGSDKKIIKTQIKEENVMLDEYFYETDGNLYLVDKSANMHLGVKYILVGENSFLKEFEILKKNVLSVLFLSMSIISIIGVFLARLFLSPVKNEIARIDKFIKDTTHELNTPVAALMMSISALKKLDIDQKIVRRVDISAKRVSDIYNDLTYLFFKDMSGKNAQLLDFKTIIENRVEYFADFAAMKKIKIELNLEEFMYKIEQESAIRLIDNLISNAIKYNKISGIIVISLKNGVLAIEDSGFGIDEKNQKEIFKRYKRADNTKGGFGIGLDIVASICRDYNIKIELDSKKNRGTVFRFIF